MKIKCDQAMKRSKEKAGEKLYKETGMPGLRCTEECERCTCGMRQNIHSGGWEHNTGEKNVTLHDIFAAGHEKE